MTVIQVERMSKCCKLDADKTVVLGCGMEGLLTVAALKTLGINKIIVIDKSRKNLVQWNLEHGNLLVPMEKNSVAGVKDKIRAATGMADAVFICTDSPIGRNVARRFIKQRKHLRNGISLLDEELLQRDILKTACRLVEDFMQQVMKKLHEFLAKAAK